MGAVMVILIVAYIPLAVIVKLTKPYGGNTRRRGGRGGRRRRW